MQKYNYELDLGTENSNSKIINQVEQGKDVLEFGPAFGRMTKYLYSQMGCNVDIVEIDEESGNAASEYARLSCVGEIYGDIEKYEWKNKLSGNKYDYIIFTDVLEHLRHPEKVLYECRNFLKKDGCILCSVPNIAHSSIIIALWNNDFTYNEVGLLDNTHIHFFTKKTFIEMAEKSGFHVERIEEVSSAVGTNEIRWTYENVPDSVKTELRYREEGEAYQYIYKLVANRTEEVVINNCNGTRGYQCICYIKQNQDVDFSESKSIRKKCTQKYVDVYFDIKNFQNVKGICIELFPEKSLINVLQVEVDGIQQNVVCNGILVKDDIYAFSKEAQIFINIEEHKEMVHIVYEVLLTTSSHIAILSEVAEIKRTIELEYAESQDRIKKIRQSNCIQKEELKNKEMQIQEVLKQKEKILEEKEKILEENGKILEENERVSIQFQHNKCELDDIKNELMEYQQQFMQKDEQCKELLERKKILEVLLKEKETQYEDLRIENEQLKQKMWNKLVQKFKRK